MTSRRFYLTAGVFGIIAAAAVVIIILKIKASSLITDKMIASSDWTKGVICIVDDVPRTIDLNVNNINKDNLRMLENKTIMEGLTPGGKYFVPNHTGVSPYKFIPRYQVYASRRNPLYYYIYNDTLAGVFGLNNAIAIKLYNTELMEDPIIRCGNSFSLDVLSILKAIPQNNIHKICAIQYLPLSDEKQRHTLLYDNYYILCYSGNYVLCIGVEPLYSSRKEDAPRVIRSIGLYNKEFIKSHILFQVLSNKSFILSETVFMPYSVP